MNLPECMSCPDDMEDQKDCNTPGVIELNNTEIVTFHTVELPADIGDDTTYPPTEGLYKNVILRYLANNHVYLYNSDGIPAKISDGDINNGKLTIKVNGVEKTVFTANQAADSEVDIATAGTLYHSLGSHTDGPIDQKVTTDTLNSKVDKVAGKGLSTNDYTTAEKTKLAGIEEGAQKNLPGTVVDADYVHTDNNYTDADKTKVTDLAEIKSVGDGLDLDTAGELTAKVKDVQIDGTSIVSSKVANIPFTTSDRLGAVKLKSWNTGNINNDGHGTIYLTPQTATQLSARNAGNGIINASNMDNAVRLALSDGVGAAYTDTEKTAARARIDADLVTLEGATDPTNATVGKIGQRYFNTTSGMLFICKAISSTTPLEYTWAPIGVQSDWAQTDATAPDFIKNKPTNVSEFTNDANYQTDVEVDTKDTAVTNALEAKINEDVMTNMTVDSTAIATTLKLINGKKNLKTGVVSSTDLQIPNASSTQTGVITSGTYDAIADNTTKIQGLQDGTVVITGLPASPTQTEITDAWKTASGLSTPFSSAKAYDQTNRKVWTYYGNSSTWEAVLADGGTVTVNKFTNSALGTIMGSTADGKVSAELDGTGTVSGWTTLKNDVTTNTADIATLQTEMATKEDEITPGTTAQYFRGDKSWQTLDKSAVGLGNVDNTSDATKKTNFTGTIAASNTGFVTGGDAHTALAGKEPTITAGTNTQYYRGDKSWATLDKSAVGLSNVDNTSDATKKSNFTGSIASGNTGFVKGGDVKTALDLKADLTDIKDGTLTIKKNGTSIGTFTANQEADSDVDVKTITATDILDVSSVTPIVSTSLIIDEAVTTAKLADDAVETDKIKDAAVTSQKIDFTTMKKWVPDYANQTKVIDTASGLVNTWTATGDGFVRCENNTYNGVNHKETVIIRVNGSVAFCSANKSPSSSSAIANYLGSAPIPVCKNDVIEYETTTSGQHNLFFIPGKWV